VAHDFVKDMIDREEGRAGSWIMFTLGGGILLLTALAASQVCTHPSHSGMIAMVAAIVLGAPLVWQALLDLWHGKSQVNELAALAVIAAFVSGAYVTAGAISFFMVISILIERRSALGARKSIESLIQLSPATARRIDETGTEQEVEVSRLQVGDRVRVRPGDNIPGDGTILSGQGTINQASITGESIPAEKTIGDDVFAGTINLTGLLEVEIRKIGEDTTLGQVKRLILQAEATRTPVMRLIDRHAGWYVPLILMLAGSVLFFTRDIERAVAMLVIACPCAIVLSGPTATVAALSAAARLGLLIKNVSDLEVARRLTAVVFDKTGTLTTGRLHLARIEPAEGQTQEDVLSVAAALEANSLHPAARAVVEGARERNVVPAGAVEGFREASGKGVQGRIGTSEVLVGRVAWLREHGVAAEDVTAADAASLSVLHVAVDGREIGWLGLEDRIRPGATEAVKAVAEAGIPKRVMLTGDRWAVARRVGNEIGCTDVLAEILPEEKMRAVQVLKDEGHVIAVVGDGVNDAPALAAGDVSIAMGAAGSDAAIHSASIALMNNELNRIPFLLHLSRRTMAVITQNLALSATSVAVFLALSAAGFVHPVLAVLLHTGSALAVIVNSARLVRTGEDLRDHDVPVQKEDTPTLRPVPLPSLEGSSC
jgi:Cd2+/Zn2+-exporting ATPase